MRRGFFFVTVSVSRPAMEILPVRGRYENAESEGETPLQSSRKDKLELVFDTSGNRLAAVWWETDAVRSAPSVRASAALNG
jgi:hypothetical protein